MKQPKSRLKRSPLMAGGRNICVDGRQWRWRYGSERSMTIVARSIDNGESRTISLPELTG